MCYINSVLQITKLYSYSIIPILYIYTHMKNMKKILMVIWVTLFWGNFLSLFSISLHVAQNFFHDYLLLYNWKIALCIS